MNYIRNLKEIIAKQHTVGSEYEDKIQLISDLEADLKREQEKTKNLQESIRLKQENLVKNEQEYTRELKNLEEKIGVRLKPNDGPTSQISLRNINRIQENYSEIMNRLGLVQHKTIQIMIEQEKEIAKEYKDIFSNLEAEINTLKKSSSTRIIKPQKKQLDLWELIAKYRLDNKNAEILNEKLSKHNEELKMDLNEQRNEIKNMKTQIDTLKIKSFLLKKELNYWKSTENNMKNTIKSPKVAVTERDFGTNIIQNLKNEISEQKKLNKEARNKFSLVQETTNELKFIIKQEIQKISEKIQKFKSLGDKNESSLDELIKKNNLLAKLYDKTFPVKLNLNKKALELPKNKIENIGITMETIEKLYDQYERNLKTSL